MNATNQKIKELASRLRLYSLPRILEVECHSAAEQGKNNVEFLLDLLEKEVRERDSRDLQRRLNAAKLPARHDLDLFDHNYSQGITSSRLRELRQLLWLEQTYNIILMGPSGTGKTFMASGLVYDAVISGYKAYMMTMEELNRYIAGEMSGYEKKKVGQDLENVSENKPDLPKQESPKSESEDKPKRRMRL